MVGSKEPFFKGFSGQGVASSDQFWFWFRFILTSCLFHTARGVLVSQPGIKPVPPAVEAWSLNHWTTREPAPDQSFDLFKEGKWKL